MRPAVTGLLAGVVGGAFAPVLIKPHSLRNTAKGMIKGALVLYERGRVGFATWSESLSDLVAEAQEEHQQDKARTTDRGSEGIVTPLKQRQAGGLPDEDG